MSLLIADISNTGIAILRYVNYRIW